MAENDEKSFLQRGEAELQTTCETNINNIILKKRNVEKKHNVNQNFRTSW